MNTRVEGNPASVVPIKVNNLRACLSCNLLKTQEQFKQYGCENCPQLNMKGNLKSIQQNTSTTFDGMIALTDPKASWVSRWQGLENYVRGVYAVTVYGDAMDGDI